MEVDKWGGDNTRHRLIEIAMRTGIEKEREKGKRGNGKNRHESRTDYPDRSGPLMLSPDEEVDMMRIEIVTDITRLARPALEHIELIRGLRHVGGEECHCTDVDHAITSIKIDRIPSFMDLDGT